MALNLALVGYGAIAHVHARAIQRLQGMPEWRDLRLVGVMGRRAEPTAEFARQYGMQRATADLAELLATPGLDAVIVTSPSELHAEQTAQALQAGVHVLCEIPLATSLADADRLIALAERAQRRLMVCHTERFYPPLVEARRLVASGALHPHAIVSRFMFPRRENVGWTGYRRSWTDNLLWHHGCHAVDAALWILGAGEVEVSAEVALPAGDLDIPMDLTLVLRTRRDQLATVVMSYHTHMPFKDYLIIGEETTLLYADGALRDRERVLVPKRAGAEVDEAVVDQDAEFCAALRERREPAVSGRAVRPALAALQAAQETLEARLRVLGPQARHPREP